MALFIASEAIALIVYHLGLTISLGSKETSLAAKNSFFNQIPCFPFLKPPKCLSFLRMCVFPSSSLYISFHLILKTMLRRQVLLLVSLFCNGYNEEVSEHIGFPRSRSSRAESHTAWASVLRLDASPHCLHFLAIGLVASLKFYSASSANNEILSMAAAEFGGVYTPITRISYGCFF